MIKYFLLLLILPMMSNAQENSPFKDSTRLRNWDRQFFSSSQYNPTVFYVVFGEFAQGQEIDSEKYGTTGLPKGIEMSVYEKNDYPDVYKSLRQLNGWDESLIKDPTLKAKIDSSRQFIIISGSISDQPSLNYFRNIVGVLTYLTDNGGVGLFDPLMSNFWSSLSWRRKIFNYNASAPRHHVIIFCKEYEDGSKWYYTNGMQKFGRPDISVRNVMTEYEDGIVDLINRTIEFLAFGAIIEDKQPIHMNSLPDGMYFENTGSFDDPIFNNVHLEVKWK